MTTEKRVWPDIAIPPGETLAETLAAVGMTQAELAKRMGRPPQAISEIIRGTKAITPRTAIQLELVLGMPAHVWVRLEADYRYNKVRIEQQAAASSRRRRSSPSSRFSESDSSRRRVAPTAANRRSS